LGAAYPGVRLRYAEGFSWAIFMQSLQDASWRAFLIREAPAVFFFLVAFGTTEVVPFYKALNGLGGGFFHFGEHLANASQGLAGALFVFYQAESYVAVAVFAEAYAGGNGHFGFGQEEL